MVFNEKFDIPSTRELFRISANRKEWNNLTPLQKWCYLYGIGKAGLGPVGYPVFQDDQTLHWNSYLIVSFMFIYAGLAAFTTVHYTLRGEIAKWLPCTILLTILGAACPLLITMLTKTRYIIHDMLLYCGQNIYANSREDTEYNRICSDNIDESVRGFFTKMAILMLSYSTILIGPTYVYFADGIRTTTTNIKFPFIAEDSDTEFMLNVLAQAYICATGILGYIGLEVVMGLFHDFANITPKLLDYELKKFDKMVASSTFSKSELNPLFKNIILQALHTDDYIATFRDVMYYRTLLTPTLFNFGIAMAIFCQFSMNYAAGYGMGIMSYVQVFYMCELGDSIEDNGFVEILYDSKWYNLPTDYQKDIMLLINRKQNGSKITVGPFGVINRQLTTDTTNKIYSLIMFLRKFSK